MHLYSEPGQGTTVKVYLPLVYRESVRPTAERADQTLPGGTESVLVVEDDPSLRAVAERLLKKVGYRVFTAADGVEGMEAYRLHGSAIALVITDVVMPKAGGFDVYNDVRRVSRATKVLITSGYAAPVHRKVVAGDGNVGFVTKPWTVNELLTQVRALLDAPAGAVR